jgi:hypothetical protein
MSSAREMISSGTHHSDGHLRKNAIGPPAILFLLITSAAPLYAMLFNVPVGINGSGFGAPSVYYRKLSPDRFQDVGRFVHHEVGDSLPETSPMPAGD